MQWIQPRTASSASTSCVDAASATDSLSEASSPSDDLPTHPTTSSPITVADELSVLSLEAMQDASEGDVNDARGGDDSASADAELLAEIAKDGLPLSLSLLAKSLTTLFCIRCSSFKDETVSSETVKTVK